MQEPWGAAMLFRHIKAVIGGLIAPLCPAAPPPTPPPQLGGKFLKDKRLSDSFVL